MQELRRDGASNPARQKVWVVLDPVMISTSGSRLLDQDAQDAIIDCIFPYIDVVTPNRFEAEALLGGRGSLRSAADVERGAAALLRLGCPAVLIKGGHAEKDTVARDYLLAARGSHANTSGEERRLCDGAHGVWFESPRYDTVHTHGTGCTLSSAMAAALALGEDSRRRRQRRTSAVGDDCSGAYTALDLVDACCLAKAYVTAGIAHGRQLGKGPGPVAHTAFPSAHAYYPTIPLPKQPLSGSFIAMHSYAASAALLDADGDECRPTLSRILPIVDSVDWVRRVCRASGGGAIQDLQLRVKGETDPARILALVVEAQALCAAVNIRLWINDYWEAAIAAGCFGVHVGQEDLFRCQQSGGLDSLRRNNMALGISTHTFGELAVALGVRPSYISLGPVFATGSKEVRFDPQGLDLVAQWRRLIPPSIPLVAIGGIGDAEMAGRVRAAGAECVAVIGAVTGSRDTDDIAAAVSDLNAVML